MQEQDWIARLGLVPHPEGGWFRRIHTEPGSVATAQGSRAAASSIHYLLTQASPVGFLHSNRSVILHFLQSGGPVEYVLLNPSQGESRRVLGFGPGQEIQLVVPGGTWKASRLLAGADHALVAEIVLPGWDAADHVFMTAEQLQRLFPASSAGLAGLLR